MHPPRVARSHRRRRNDIGLGDTNLPNLGNINATIMERKNAFEDEEELGMQSFVRSHYFNREINLIGKC